MSTHVMIFLNTGVRVKLNIYNLLFAVYPPYLSSNETVVFIKYCIIGFD